MGSDIVGSVPRAVAEGTLGRASIGLGPAKDILVTVCKTAVKGVKVLTLPTAAGRTYYTYMSCVYSGVFLFCFLLTGQGEFITVNNKKTRPGVSGRGVAGARVPLPPLSRRRQVITGVRRLFIRFSGVRSSLRTWELAVKVSRS